MKRLLYGALLCAAIHYPSSAQITIASEDFESSSSTLFSFAGGSFFSGTTSTETPGGVPQFADGLQSRGVQNGRDTITSLPNTLNTQGYTNVALYFKLASISGTGSNGADAADSVVVEVSVDAGATFTRCLSVRGNSNARWAFSATGSAAAAYPVATDAPAASGGTLATGPANISLTGLPSMVDLRIRIRLRNNDAAERWLMDSLRIVGTTAGPACTAPASAPTSLLFPSATTTSISGSFAAASGGADGYVIFSAPAAVATAPTLADGTTYTASTAPAGYAFVSSGSGTAFTAGDLSQGTAYNFFVYAFNNSNCSGGPAYHAAALAGTASTQSVPACTAPAPPANVSVNPSFNSASGTFTAPTPAADSVVIFYAVGSTPPPVLADGTTYNAANTPGSYALVGKDAAGNTAFTILGLAASMPYSVYIFSYNRIGCTGGPVYSASATATFTTTPVAIATYTWNVGSGLWSAPASWTPARATPAATDVLVFDGTTQPAPVVILDYASTESISQLKFLNGVAALFQTAANRVLSIGDGAPGDDLLLPAGAKLSIQSTANSVGLTLSVTAGNTGLISDTVKLAGSASTSQAHRILSADVSGIDVDGTGVIEQGGNFSGTVFGNSAPANTVEFLSGASLVLRSGTNVFGLTGANSKALYNANSNVYFANGGSITAPGSGRTYPNLHVVNNTRVGMSGSGNFTLNNLHVEAGSGFEFDGSVSNIITVGGNITADGPASLKSGSGGIEFTAAAPFIGGTDRVTLGGAVNVSDVTFGNADSVVLSAPMTVTGTLTLSAGRIVTGANVLTLGMSPAAPGVLVYSGGVIEGTFKRYFGGATNTGNSGLFPMGRPGTGERRMAMVEFTTAPASGGSLTAFVDSASLNTISATVATDGGCPSGFTVTTLTNQYLTIAAGDGLAGGVFDITLQHQNPGGVSNLCELAVAKRADENGIWMVDGVQDFGAGTMTEPIVRHTALTGFSDFILAGASSNPLPLGLTLFDAVADRRTARLTWTLADAGDVKHISIERSHDGRAFATIGSPQMAGAEGMFVDETPIAGRNFYRLRIVANTGAESLSAVRLVSFTDVAKAGITVYPNPASDAIRIQGSGAISATLYDAAGRSVSTVNDASAPVTISLEDIAGGLYLLHATDGATTVRERVLIIH